LQLVPLITTCVPTGPEGGVNRRRVADAAGRLTARYLLDGYRKALQVANRTKAMEQDDVPMLYVVADAEAGAANSAFMLARAAPSPEERGRLLQEAQSYRQWSAETGQHVPNPAQISPSGFLVETHRGSSR
jgi:hypothetical protein